MNRWSTEEYGPDEEDRRYNCSPFVKRHRDDVVVPIQSSPERKPSLVVPETPEERWSTIPLKKRMGKRKKMSSLCAPLDVFSLQSATSVHVASRSVAAGNHSDEESDDDETQPPDSWDEDTPVARKLDFAQEMIRIYLPRYFKEV